MRAPGTVFWTASSGDALGNVTSERLGNQLQTTRAFDAVTGRLSSLRTVDAASGSIQNLGYTGNVDVGATRPSRAAQTPGRAKIIEY